MKRTQIPAEELLFPGLKVHQLTRRVTWQFYKHWGQGYRAGEGKREYYGDRSGCVTEIGGMEVTSVPHVVQARLYESRRGRVSAVYSYPMGIGLVDHYFWEIYGVDTPRVPDEPERYDTEGEMERRIIEVIG